MTRADVAEVISRLALAQAAADVLADGGLEPVIDLSDDGLMLTAAWSGEVGAAEAAERFWPVVIEDTGATAPSGAPPCDADPAGGAWLVTDLDTIDDHLMRVTRRGDWHMAADLALLRAVLDHADVVGRPVADVAERLSRLTCRARIDVAALAARLEALLACALEDEPVAETMAEDTGAAQPQPEPAGEQAAEAPLPEDKLGGDGGGLQRLVPAEDDPLPAGGDALPAGDPVDDPAPTAGESGLAADEDTDLPGSSPSAEPPAAVTGTAAAVEAPPLPGQHPPAGEGKGAPAYGIWMTKEDDQLVAGMAERIHAGESRHAAAIAMADVLGRPVEGARWRANTKLKDRIAAAVAALRAPAVAPAQAPVSAAAAPEVPVAPVPAPEEAVAAPTPRGKAFRPPMPDGLSSDHRRVWSWLDGLDITADFGPGDDLFVVEAFAKGTKAPMLAVDMGVDTKALLDRYKALTRPIRNGRDQIMPDQQAKLAQVLRLRKEAFAGAKAV